MSSQTRRKQLRSRITAIWLSVLSWMHWRRRRAEKRELQERLQARRQQEQLEQIRLLLWDLAMPLAEALGRLDHHQQLTRSKVQVMGQELKELRSRQEELLLEILQSTQLSAEQQMFPLIGLPPQLTSSPSSGN